jgi:hypothetical protein
MNLRFFPPVKGGKFFYKRISVDRQAPRNPRLVGGVEGRNINEISFPGSPRPVGGEIQLVDESEKGAKSRIS